MLLVATVQCRDSPLAELCAGGQECDFRSKRLVSRLAAALPSADG